MPPLEIPDDLLDQLADRVADRIAQRLGVDQPSPWMTTVEAIEYTRIPEGTFRKLAASGRIPSHGGKSKLFHRAEVDQALLGPTSSS